VGSARADGYHPVDSCIAKITLYDRIDLLRRDEEDKKISLMCEGVNCGPVEENLAYRAAALLAGGRNVPGVEIRLSKKIPPGGGLGGGSSDAAAVLTGLSVFWNLFIPNEELCELAAKLGSDVPLFLGSASCRGGKPIAARAGAQFLHSNLPL